MSRHPGAIRFTGIAFHKKVDNKCHFVFKVNGSMIFMDNIKHPSISGMLGVGRVMVWKRMKKCHIILERLN